MIVKQRYMFLWEEAMGQFYTRFRDSRWYICSDMDEPLKCLFAKPMSLYSRFFKENCPILQSIFQNVNHVLQM